MSDAKQERTGMNPFYRTNLLGLLAVVLVLVGIPGYAQSHEAEEHVAEEHSHLHSHHLGLFVGATSKFEEGGTYFSLGLEYEYLLDKEHGRWKLGVVGELIFGHKTEYLIAVPVIFRAYKGLFVLAGPGLEWFPSHEEEGDEHHDPHAMGNSEGSEGGYDTHVLLRIGAGYQFHVGKFSITPVVNLDMWRKHHSLVWGISIGRGF
jgi:hypothetical protein